MTASCLAVYYSIVTSMIGKVILPVFMIHSVAINSFTMTRQTVLSLAILVYHPLKCWTSICSLVYLLGTGLAFFTGT